MYKRQLYADADRGGTDTPVAGELGMGAGQTVISRMIWQPTNPFDPNSFFINDNNNPLRLNLFDFFDPGGAAHGWTWYFKTATGEISFPVSSTLDATGGGFARFRLPVGHAGIAFFNGLSAGEGLIVGLGYPAPA